jgi:hypothetical protein
MLYGRFGLESLCFVARTVVFDLAFMESRHTSISLTSRTSRANFADFELIFPSSLNSVNAIFCFALLCFAFHRLERPVIAHTTQSREFPVSRKMTAMTPKLAQRLTVSTLSTDRDHDDFSRTC